MKRYQNAVPDVQGNGIPSPEQFVRILERERERSDRSGQIFSLVLFESAGPAAADGSFHGLVESLVAERVRTADEIGWFQEGILGVILPATYMEGAWKFANDIRNRFPRENLQPNCRVFTYPSSWFLNGHDDEEMGTGNGREKRKDDPSIAPDVRDGARRMGISEGMGSLLCHPMPRWKRAFDILGSLVGLILCSPLFLLIAIFIKAVSPGPVFYSQERIGYLGRRFTFWKFRTMHTNNDATGHMRYLSRLIEGDAPMEKLDDGRDARIIPFGRFLRSSCLDELPQLVNVLLGEMSLVGPRPCLPYEAKEYLQWHARRFDIVPGMTGLWQVSGKNRLTFKEMIRLDIRYSQALSPWLDVKILLLTLPAILGMVSHSLSGLRETRQERAGFLNSLRW